MRSFSRWFVTMAVTAILSACGGDDDLGSFLGEWQYTSGTANTQCTLGNVSSNDTEQLTGDKFRIAKGVGNVPLVLSEVDTNCVWQLSVNGNVASINSGQTCTVTGNTISYTAATLTVTGTTATFSGSATAMVNVNGLVVPCSITASGGLTKVAN